MVATIVTNSPTDTLFRTLHARFPVIINELVGIEPFIRRRRRYYAAFIAI